MVALLLNLIMGGFLKLLILFGVIYLGYRLITKPFRDYAKAVKRNQRSQSSNKKTKKASDKTDNLGDYIDYEEVE